MSEPPTSKSHTDENFPVASVLIAPRHRPIVLAFYRVARMADDIADSPIATRADKRRDLDAIERSLTGQDDEIAAAAKLRQMLLARGLSLDHVLDLLKAFRRDIDKSRYADWGELMDYCRYSAAPVGRFMLDVHGESPATWPASDALCAALQVINHVQDCAKDYRDMDRVYLPSDLLIDVRLLSAPRSSPVLLGAIRSVTERAQALLSDARVLAPRVRDLRLALEIGVIHRLAESLTRRLMRRDPLCQPVHHRPIEVMGLAVLGAAGVIGQRRAP